MKFRMTLGGTAAVLFFLAPIAGPIALEAQGPDGRWPLQPRSSMNRVVAPFMEGWYENEDYFSRSTSRHHSYARPLNTETIQHVSTQDLKNLMFRYIRD